jgi:protein-L-isoaspartate O-methyltransferase
MFQIGRGRTGLLTPSARIIIKCAADNLPKIFAQQDAVAAAKSQMSVN